MLDFTKEAEKLVENKDYESAFTMYVDKIIENNNINFAMKDLKDNLEKEQYRKEKYIIIEKVKKRKI